MASSRLLPPGSWDDEGLAAGVFVEHDLDRTCLLPWQSAAMKTQPGVGAGESERAARFGNRRDLEQFRHQVVLLSLAGESDRHLFGQ